MSAYSAMWLAHLLVVLLLFHSRASGIRDYEWEHQIFSCHSTDFECFKRQYRALRDHVLLGNARLEIDPPVPYVFADEATSSVVSVSGLEDSELVGIVVNMNAKSVSMALQFPCKIQQLKNETQGVEPNNIGRSFIGNATVEVSYPVYIEKKNKEIYLVFLEEDVDVILDLLQTPEESDPSNPSDSEWAYEMVKNIDAADYYILPYTGKMKTVSENLPLKKWFLLLYPDEKLEKVYFEFFEDRLLLKDM